ncbi:carbohydrate binding domain-containing protein [uncultured Polaribacter sp.]|uniref:carbohydrate binding domain-containing protein n=1 Tax=uncultured Polaribacter sp. TaxID=174711 RepID=UPI0026276725|nr:carbohydrate binding domain-containing protein [uncultured Polaribacter sp.]
MKITKFLSLLLLVTAFISCEESETPPELVQPTFTATVSPDNSGIYLFENTTPNKGEFFSVFEFDIAGDKAAAHNEGTVTYEYSKSGNKIVTLTMLGDDGYLQTSKSISVTVVPVFTAFDSGIVLNGGLEEGSGDNFTNWNKFDNGSGATMSEETTIFRNGLRSLKVTNPNDNPGEQWRTQFVSDAIATTVGTTYVVSFWVKGDPVIVRASTNANLGNESYMADITTGSDWTEYSQEFTALVDSTTIVLDLGASAGTFYVDDIRVVAK